MQEISDEILHAFADNELSGDEKAALLERIAADGALRTKVCETWHLKELVRSAHPLPGRQAPGRARKSWWTHLGLPMAACLLLVIGAGSGWLAHEEYDDAWVPPPQVSAIQAHGNRVVLHLVSGNPQDLEAALRKAEQLASTKDKSGGLMQVELIANGTGIRLLQAEPTPVAQKVMAIHHNHVDNLRLVACNEAMNRLRERGVEITLLPDVEVVPSAIDQIAARLNQGWRYLQV